MKSFALTFICVVGVGLVTSHPVDPPKLPNPNPPPPPPPVHIVGGISDVTKPADAQVREALSGVLDELKTTALQIMQGPGANIDTRALQDVDIDILSYKTQTVAGTNYFAKILVNDKIFHARIYQPISGPVQVHRVIGPKKQKEPIAYFD